MKKGMLASLCILIMMAFTDHKPKPCGTWNGHNIYKGEKGGCFYLKGKKKERIYIDKKHCKC